MSLKWHRAARAAGWLGPWIALASLSLWAASPGPAALVLAASGATAALLWGPRRRGIAWGAGSAILVLAILAAFGAQRQVGELTSGWDEYWAEREDEVGRIRLDAALQGLLAAGEVAADSLAGMAAALVGSQEQDASALQRLRVRHGASALALYDRQGQLILWDGEHRGKVPEAAQSGEQRYIYNDLPLFGYLYVTAAAPNGSVAVAAHLLRTDLPLEVGADVGDFRSEFLRETGETIRISAESPNVSEVVREFTVPGGERLLSVVIERPELAERVSTVMGRWQALVSMSLLLSWLLLAVGGPPRLAAGTVAAGSLLFLAAFLPLDQVDRLTALFGAGVFELPGPLPISLGRFGLLALAGFTVIAVLPRPKLEIPFWAAGFISGLLFPLAILVTQGGLHAESLAGGRLEWIAYQGTLAAVLTLIVGSALAFTRARPEGNQGLGAAAMVVAIALAAAGATYVGLDRTLPIWWTALWCVPTSLAAASIGGWAGWQRPLVGWLMAGVLAGTAALPAAWQQQIAAEVARGTAQLTAIAAPEDLALRRGLLRLGEVADSLERAGKGDLDVMYGAWRGSGLADDAVPLRITIWREGGDSAEGLEAADELRIGVGTDRPGRIADIARDTHERGSSELFHLRWDDARYVIGVPLSRGRVLTAVGPAISTFASFRSALAALMQGGSGSVEDPITFIRLLEDDPHDSGPIDWARTSRGWQGDLEIEFDNSTYHVHYLVELPGWLLASARGSLLLALDLLVFFSFWLGGRALLREVKPEEMRVSGWVISFRARVTLALFGFFVLANALFGTIAYRTLAQASERAAEAIAERVVEDAADLYLSLAGATGETRMERLAQQVGFELLEYVDGELREGSVEELVELGLYEGWMPLAQHRLLDGREGIRVYTSTSMGRWQYITAYRRLPDGDILGVQIPLQAGAAAIQTSDLIELMGFAILVGGALSLVLAWMAGRALTSPIRALQVASEAVGAGNLQLQLPSTRADEFGAVFRAFNRMVSRVRRARRQLVRTSRRTQAIMDEAAVGMIALDPAGRVMQVNPRAEDMLGSEVFVGRSVPGEGPLGEALSGWLAHFLAGSADQADVELHANNRRVRVRASRLGSLGSHRGVVLSLDDVTDKLRAERVLAWGEMAQQVAHEVKNPLTPIKLSIQHIRRAWEDEATDFNEILVRNADAMLAEIDRLAMIAQSFSRFGAPSGEGETPLSTVSISAVVDDVMALYGGGSSPLVSFEEDVPDDLPTVVSRASELKEVLVNLMENARDAIGDRGFVRICGRVDGDDTVIVEVVDDGSGIDEALLPRIFEPRFSTRSTGAGLGLPIVQRLVNAWGGSVDVTSVPGEGTTVSIRLKRSDSPR